MSDPGSHEPELQLADLANRLQLPQQGCVGVGAGRGQLRRFGVPRAAPQLGLGGFYSEGTGGHPQGTVPRPSRGNAGGVLGKVCRVVSSAMGTPGKFPTDVLIPGQDASDAPDALGKGLVDSAEMVADVPKVLWHLWWISPFGFPVRLVLLSVKVVEKCSQRWNKCKSGGKR